MKATLTQAREARDKVKELIAVGITAVGVNTGYAVVVNVPKEVEGVAVVVRLVGPIRATDNDAIVSDPERPGKVMVVSGGKVIGRQG